MFRLIFYPINCLVAVSGRLLLNGLNPTAPASLKVKSNALESNGVVVCWEVSLKNPVLLFTELVRLLL